MRRLVLIVVLFSMTSVAYGQRSGQLAFPSIVPFGASNSIIDQNGNLIIFDVSYTYPPTANQSSPVRFPPIAKTHVTVIAITATGTPTITPKTSFDYDGALQVVGVGRRAVYAIVSTTTATVTPLAAPGQVPTSIVSGGAAGAGAITVPIVPVPFTVNRRLVALNTVAGSLPASLPSIDTLGGADVKISTDADTGTLDTIALIDSPFSPPILAPVMTGASTSTSSHSVRLFTFNGAMFAPINQTPISVP
jgi:hypothetical protein